MRLFQFRQLDISLLQRLVPLIEQSVEPSDFSDQVASNRLCQSEIGHVGRISAGSGGADFRRRADIGIKRGTLRSGIQERIRDRSRDCASGFGLGLAVERYQFLLEILCQQMSLEGDDITHGLLYLGQ